MFLMLTRINSFIHTFTLITGLLFAAQFVHAQSYITIIIDDVGYNTSSAIRLAKFPYPITCAILPDAASSEKSAAILSQSNKELMLHVPMQGRLDQAREPNVLHGGLSEEQFVARLQAMLNKIPNIAGLNNHQGSLLTRQPEPMDWLMREVKKIDNFYFVDSMTSAVSIGWKSAKNHNIPHARRHIFIDHERTPEFIQQQLSHLINIAKKRGFALGIGHPYKETLDALEQFLPSLHAQGIRLIPASEYVQRKTQYNQSIKLSRKN